jgi:hypothetical protein
MGQVGEHRAQARSYMHAGFRMPRLPRWLRTAAIHGIIGVLPHPRPAVSHADYTSNVFTSARMAAGMTSRARRPYIGYSAG